SGKLSAIGNSLSTPIPTEPALFKVDSGKISQLAIQNADGDSLKAQLGNDGNWTVTEPKGSPVTASQIESAILEIKGWTVMSELDPAPPLSSMGLDSPANVIKLTGQNGQVQSIVIGNSTPSGIGYYVELNGGAPLIISKSNVDQVLQVIPARPTQTAAPVQNQTTTPTP
ncbi:MAG TPA: DUF4340 domain-containing protein, partial [Anaerolineaceae bacterium]|nr:DUF4340 domain-containing protein [Anaerolineaceae bacterium]